MRRAHNKLDETSKRYGRWLVIKEAASQVSPSGNTKAMWLCKCDCGTERAVAGADLRKGKSVSCGCYSKELTLKRCLKHGSCDSKPYKAWANIKNRCLSKGTPDYAYYGDLGITICERWKDSFQNFYNDVGDPPTELHTIDRIDVTKGYSPENCRWATRKEQTRNRRCTIKYTYEGVTKPSGEWDEEMGLPMGTIHGRISSLGWSLEKALLTPLKDSLTDRPDIIKYHLLEGKSVEEVQERLNLSKWIVEDCAADMGWECL